MELMLNNVVSVTLRDDRSKNGTKWTTLTIKGINYNGDETTFRVTLFPKDNGEMEFNLANAKGELVA